MRRVHVRSLLAAVALTVGFVASVPSPAPAAPAWAPAATATVHPGVQMFTAGAQCTADFVFFQGATVFIGQAAHCSSTEAATSTNGCSTSSLPLGTPVQVDGASQPGTLVYNSWLAMHAVGESDPDTCQFNDLALVQLAPVDAAATNPSIPVWGGPSGVGPAVPSGGAVYSYGNSILRGGITQLSPKLGFSVGAQPSGWATVMATLTPGIPGDSGSAVLDSTGRAVGVLSTIDVLPVPASNTAGAVAKELAYARSHSSFSGLELATGTVAFHGGAAPLISGLLG